LVHYRRHIKEEYLSSRFLSQLCPRWISLGNGTNGQMDEKCIHARRPKKAEEAQKGGMERRPILEMSQERVTLLHYRQHITQRRKRKNAVG
jgi:hypothetical protein